ncbi:hypothetical protein NDU88_006238 [Pleurodeles waltl]|uniref:Uncharacterized protein n=1 Tax=Pleurodeles waltl TaxID=8319 RepID=A0AAV7UKY1_PLEWA|nr:hypothetical protein NDU88_006238 [Pleurodeles waltl]
MSSTQVRVSCLTYRVVFPEREYKAYTAIKNGLTAIVEINEERKTMLTVEKCFIASAQERVSLLTTFELVPGVPVDERHRCVVAKNKTRRMSSTQVRVSCLTYRVVFPEREYKAYTAIKNGLTAIVEINEERKTMLTVECVCRIGA